MEKVKTNLQDSAGPLTEYIRAVGFPYSGRGSLKPVCLPSLWGAERLDELACWKDSWLTSRSKLVL